MNKLSQKTSFDFLNINPSDISTDSSLTNFSGKVIHFINTYNLALAKESTNYFHSLQSGNSVCMIDSFALKLFLRLRYRKEIFQIRGIDFLRMILQNKGIAHIFICPNIQNQKLLISGNFGELKLETFQYYVPPIDDNIIFLQQEIEKNVNIKDGQFIWIGLGTPKQDLIAKELIALYPSVTIVCIGAALEIFTGQRKEVPISMQKIGLEWFFRFVQEPRRLFSRYFIFPWKLAPFLFSINFREKLL